jgi:muramidase (phage lysozyme)
MMSGTNVPTFSEGWKSTLAKAGSTPDRFSPQHEALLRTIRYAEGTWHGGKLAGGDNITGDPRGFKTIQGYGTFEDTSRHPRKLGPLSDAAGAYQIISPTDEGASRLVGTTDFSPMAQGNKALALARQRMMNIGGLSYLNKNGLDDTALAALSPEWASFPNLKGVSAYGQPVKKAKDLKEFYNSQLERLRGSSGEVATTTPQTSDTTTAQSPTPVSANPGVTVGQLPDGTQQISTNGTNLFFLPSGDKKKEEQNYLASYLTKNLLGGGDDKTTQNIMAQIMSGKANPYGDPLEGIKDILV